MAGQGRVVHTAWGPSERWEELGANDAHTASSLIGGTSRHIASFMSDSRRLRLLAVASGFFDTRFCFRAPAYGFVNEGSQRQDR